MNPIHAAEGYSVYAAVVGYHAPCSAQVAAAAKELRDVEYLDFGAM